MLSLDIVKANEEFSVRGSAKQEHGGDRLVLMLDGVNQGLSIASNAIICATNWKIEQPTQPPAFTVRPPYLLSDSIDFGLLREKIAKCVQLADRGCAPRVPLGMKVLDCKARRVVPYDRKSAYLPLSYVWGQPTATSDPHMAFHTLDKQSLIPRAIEDAIAVTLSLGKVHLWIDRCCIEQSNTQQKQSQIQNMSSIFENSWIPIVSL
jgi:hypothetical protein